MDGASGQRPRMLPQSVSESLTFLLYSSVYLYHRTLQNFPILDWLTSRKLGLHAAFDRADIQDCWKSLKHGHSHREKWRKSSLYQFKLFSCSGIFVLYWNYCPFCLNIHGIEHLFAKIQNMYLFNLFSEQETTKQNKANSNQTNKRNISCHHHSCILVPGPES